MAEKILDGTISGEKYSSSLEKEESYNSRNVYSPSCNPVVNVSRASVISTPSQDGRSELIHKHNKHINDLKTYYNRELERLNERIRSLENAKPLITDTLQQSKQDERIVGQLEERLKNVQLQLTDHVTQLGVANKMVSVLQEQLALSRKEQAGMKNELVQLREENNLLHDSLRNMQQAVKIVVSSTKENKETTLLTGYLCSMSRNVHTIVGFTSLPLLLIKAPSAVSKIFLSWLHITFDCYTTHFTLYGPELRYLMTQFVIESGGHKVIAVYDSPAKIKEAGLSEVTLELSAADTADIMTSLQQHFTDDQVGTEFLNIMEQDLFAMTHIKLENFTLSKFVTSFVSLDKTGRIKLAQADKVHGILMVLTSLILAPE